MTYQSQWRIDAATIENSLSTLTSKSEISNKLYIRRIYFIPVSDSEVVR